jgi:hypothetical protein
MDVTNESSSISNFCCIFDILKLKWQIFLHILLMTSCRLLE